MNLFKTLLLTAATGLFLSSCTVGTIPVGATGNDVGSKVGTASSDVILFLFQMNDGGVAKAAKNGKISKISTVDVKSTSFFVYTRVKTTVTGE